MKISYNWLKTLLPIQHSPEEIEAILTGTGLEVEHYGHIDSIKGGLRGLIAGEVKECVRHPNADKLSLCKVDTGSGEWLSIVCGAPNVRAGQKVIVAPVGTEIHPLNGEPFTIQRSKIRGEYSEGMLCAEDEIGLGESHDGILVLPEDTVPGTVVAEIFGVESDVVFEIGLTANRGDAASHAGIARELATVLNIPFEIPETTLIPDSTNAIFSAEIRDTKACPRYCGILLENVSVKESPDWLKNRLLSIGLRPINNVVDITNFVMHELGQPLHAFDRDRLEGDKIIVRRAGEGEKFTTLDGAERTLRGEELMICDGAGPVCMAGIYGGAGSGVTQDTKRVFLESAYFSPDVIRKAAKHHGLNTDSSFRFERGTDPDMCIPALKKAVMLLKEYAGAGTCSAILDEYPEKIEPFRVTLRKPRIRRLTGTEIPADKIRQILTGLGISIMKEDDEKLELEVPPFKSDVCREADVIEELIRIYGFGHIPLQKHLRMSLNYDKSQPLRETEKRIAFLLSANGFHEIMNNSLSSDRYYTDKSTLVRVSNPLSAEMNVMRGSLLYGALESMAWNRNRKQTATRFFEFGKTYSNKEKGFSEKEQLIIIASGYRTDESWEEKQVPADAYFIKSVARKVYDLLGVKDVEIVPETVDTATLKMFDLKDPVHYVVLDWTKAASRKKTFALHSIPQFPVVRRDLSLVLDKSIRFEQVLDIIRKKGGKTITSGNVFDVYEGKPLENHQRALSISLELSNETRTLSDADIDPVVEGLMKSFESELKAIIRK